MSETDGSNEINKLSNTPASSAVRNMPEDFAASLEEEIAAAGGAWQEDEEFKGSVGKTMFDTPTSQDNTVTVLMGPHNIAKLPSQSLVRIKSRAREKGGDGREYLGAVTQGPFAEPDGLRADAPVVVIPTVRGGVFMPKYHGRVQIEILGEEVDGSCVPARFRPLPNSPVFAISDLETSNLLGLGGEIEIGYAVGFENMPVSIPKRKAVLPRHLAVLGTTGGGKSTTVSGLIHQFSKTGIATVVLDTEGEYTEIGAATEDKDMIRLLKRNKRKAEGVADLHVYHLVGTNTTAPEATQKTPFKVNFSSLSPYAVAEILELNDAQMDRFFKAYDTTKLVLRDLSIFPKKGVPAEERAAIELNEFETGYPRMTLSHLIDIGTFFLNSLAGSQSEPFNAEFKSSAAQAQINNRIATVHTSSEISWKALLGKLYRLNRLRIFDNLQAEPIRFDELVQPGRTSLIDLSDLAESPYIRNLVITDILRGLQIQQEIAYASAEAKGEAPTPLMVIIEESHEFLSRDRIAKMHNLFEQVARIARRGRKRWMGLMFVTQLPQHLPDELFSLVNNYILHKIGDSNVIARLRKSVGGIDDSMWKRLPNLAPGYAIVSAMSMTRPLLTTINPTPCKLRMIE